MLDSRACCFGSRRMVRQVGGEEFGMGEGVGGVLAGGFGEVAGGEDEGFGFVVGGGESFAVGGDDLGGGGGMLASSPGADGVGEGGEALDVLEIGLDGGGGVELGGGEADFHEE